MRTRDFTRLACAFALAAAPLGSARAANPCAEDARALCPKDVAARDRAAVKACLLREVPRLSPACRALITKGAPAATAKPDTQK